MAQNNKTLDQMRWLPARNTDPVNTIPAFGVVGIKGSNPNGDLLVAQFAGSDSVAINGPNPIAPMSSGRVSQDFPLFVLYDPADGPPVVGEVYGAQIGSFLMKKGNSGFQAGSSDPNGTGRVLLITLSSQQALTLETTPGNYPPNITLTDINTLTFDTRPDPRSGDYGRVLLQEGGSHVASISLMPATRDWAGVVNTGKQEFGGPKKISTGAGVAALSWGYDYNDGTKPSGYLGFSYADFGVHWISQYVRFGLGNEGWDGNYNQINMLDLHPEGVLLRAGAYSAMDQSNQQQVGETGTYTVAGEGSDSGKTITVTVTGGIITAITKV